MDKKSSENEPIDNDDQPKSLFYLRLRSNWIPLLFALIITILTIIVVPIIYSIPKSVPHYNGTNLAWDINGATYVDKNSLFNKINLTLGNISALAFDQENNLHFVDQTNNRILKITNDKIEIIVGHQNGTNGSDQTSLYSPNDIHIDKSNNIYIADTLNHRIQLFSNTDNKYISTVFGTGQQGSGSNQLNCPMGVTIDDYSTIYIADYGNNRIISFKRNNNVAEIYLKKNENNQERNEYVMSPISIKYDSVSKTIVIAQETGFNVIRWHIDSTYWTLIAGSASSDLSGISRTLFNKLRHVYVDRFGHLYVADCFNQRIQYFTYSLDELVKGKTIAGVILAYGNNSYIFNQPTAIALDQDQNLYVADSLNYRIQLFKQTSFIPTN
ncbi:unnamed protein product [Rotaria sp. Silwood2]|nr:unnamed protein product [Rotaria sp. Silwood2]